MEETNWIGESGGRVSDPANWDNGVPDHRTKAIFDVSERTEITWDLKSLGIPVEILCDPEDVIIYISGDCLVGGSYFVPDTIQDHFEAFKDESLNPDELDRPPPGYGMFSVPTACIWTNGNSNGNWEEAGNWDQTFYPGENNNDDTAVFDGNVNEACSTSGALPYSIGKLDIQSGYTQTVTLGGNLTTNAAGGIADGSVTVDSGELDAGSYTIQVDGNWDSSGGTFTIGESTIQFTSDAECKPKYTTTQTANFYDFKVDDNITVTLKAHTIVGNTLDINGGGGVTSNASEILALWCDTATPFSIDAGGDLSGVYRFSIRNNQNYTFPGNANYHFVSLSLQATDTTIDVTLDGAVTCSSAFRLYNAADDLAGTLTLDTNNYNITAAELTIARSGYGTHYKTLNCGSSIIDIVATAGVTINSAGTIDADTSTIQCAHSWTNYGTFTKDTSTVIFNGSSASNQTIISGGDAFYGLTFNNNSGAAEIIITDALNVDGAFALTDGQVDMDSNNPDINTAGNVTITNGCILTAGSGTWTFYGSTNYTDNTSSGPQDIGDIRVHETNNSLTLLSGIQARDLTIEEYTTLDAGGAYTIKVKGDWVKHPDHGTFTMRTSTVELNGTTTQWFSCNQDPVYNLTISNSASEHIDFWGVICINGTFDCSNSNCTLDLTHPTPNSAVVASGDVTFGNGFSVIHGSLAWTFDGTLTYTDNNDATVQNLGDVILDAGAGSIIVTLASCIRFIDITIGSNATFASGNNGIFCEGDWTRYGNFTYGTSHVYFEGTSTITNMYGLTHQFYDVTVKTGCTATTEELINYNTIEDGSCLTKGLTSSGNTMKMHHVVVDGTFFVSKDQVDGAC